MPTVHFRGRVLPAAILVSVKDLPHLHWEEAGTGQTMEIITTIQDSVVDVEFSLNHYSEDDRPSLTNRAWDMSRAAVDAFCFRSGIGLTVYIDKYVDPAGMETDLIPCAPAGMGFPPIIPGSSITLTNEYHSVYLSLINEPFLFMAMNDLITSFTLPHVAPTNCARAMDAIRNLMAPAERTKAAGWLVVQANLNLEAEYIKFISKWSEGPRHADRTFIPGVTVNECYKRSFLIMERFLEFRKRGGQPLPLNDFPLMTG